MKFCLNSKQTHEYLNKSNEIKVLYKDRNTIIDFVEKYPNKTIILDLKGYNGLIEWDDVQRYNKITHENFIIALTSLADVKECKKENIKFYWNFPIDSFYDLQALKNLGASYAIIQAPLTHNIEKAANVGIPLRLIPNIAYYAFIPREDGVCGGWVRPEDLELYEPYVAAIEFDDCDIKKEQALYRIYAEQKAWPGDLGMIITNLNHLGVNRMIPREMTEKRMSCGQRCQSGSSCQLCYRYLNLANPDLLKPYIQNN